MAWTLALTSAAGAGEADAHGTCLVAVFFAALFAFFFDFGLLRALACLVLLATVVEASDDAPDRSYAPTTSSPAANRARLAGAAFRAGWAPERWRAAAGAASASDKSAAEEATRAVMWTIVKWLMCVCRRRVKGVKRGV